MASYAKSSNGEAQSVPGLIFGPGGLFHRVATHGSLLFGLSRLRTSPVHCTGQLQLLRNGKHISQADCRTQARFSVLYRRASQGRLLVFGGGKGIYQQVSGEHQRPHRQTTLRRFHCCQDEIRAEPRSPGATSRDLVLQRGSRDLKVAAKP